MKAATQASSPSTAIEGGAGSRLPALNDWVAQVAALTRPAAIHWCDGSDAENALLTKQMLADGTLLIGEDDSGTA